MKPELRHIGSSRTPIVVADDFTDDPGTAVELATKLAPFPPSVGTYYPGLRRLIPDGTAAFSYVQAVLERAAPLIGGAFDAVGFDLLEASFSMVTTPPVDLQPPQRGPHFDSTDPNHLAVMHYLRETTGTAFFRQRATGIEVVDPNNVTTFVETAKKIAPGLSGYMSGSGRDYEEIGRITGKRDRLAIYPGSLLHSGVIDPDIPLSENPHVGRLTTNIFIRIHRDP